MSDSFTEDNVLPSAMTIARISISETVENTVKRMEGEYEREFRQKYNRAPDEKDRLHLRRIVLKIYRDYFTNSIETMDYYQKFEIRCLHTP